MPFCLISPRENNSKLLHDYDMLLRNVGNNLIKCQSERHIIIGNELIKERRSLV